MFYIQLSEIRKCSVFNYLKSTNACVRRGEQKRVFHTLIYSAILFLCSTVIPFTLVHIYISSWDAAVLWTVACNTKRVRFESHVKLVLHWRVTN